MTRRKKPTLFLDRIRAQRRVKDHDTLDIVVFGVLLVKHRIGDVRDIVPSVALSRDVDLSTMEVEGVDKILEESQELLCDVFLRCCIRRSLRKAGSNGPDEKRQFIVVFSQGTFCAHCSTQTMFVKLTQVYGFLTGLKVPYCHRKGPFSWSNPSSELHPGPPLSQIVISSPAKGLSDGKNQKYSCLSSLGSSEMGRRPA